MDSSGDPEEDGEDRLSMQILFRFHQGDNKEVRPVMFLFVEEKLALIYRPRLWRKGSMSELDFVWIHSAVCNRQVMTLLATSPAQAG